MLRKISTFVSSDKFFTLIIALFVFQAAWIAISAAYPQPFDENTHFSLIKLYSQYWSPFLSSQPPNADILGAVTRDPSYLYHYMMSFPLRIISHWTQNPPAQVILLRFINITFFAASLVIFRKVLKKTKATPGIINTTFLFFILIPVVPLLAGQINYDSLLILLTATTLLLALHFLEKLQNKQLAVTSLLSLAAITMLGCLVKTEFLPIFLAVNSLLAYKVLKYVLEHYHKKRKLILSKTKFSCLVCAGIFFIISLGLFWQRYGVNFIRYGTPVPKCEQVLNIKQCHANGTWRRGYYATLHPQESSHNPIRYMVSWQVRMFLTSFYVRSGGASSHAYYKNVGPYPIIGATAVIVFIAGGILFLRYSRSLLKQHPALVFLLSVAIFYCAVLWLHLYSGHTRTGQKFGINGRYLFPIILPIMLAIGLGVQRALEYRALFKPVLLITVFLLFLQGGGILTFIVASNQYWYWQNNNFVTGLNQGAQKIIRPLVLEEFSQIENIKTKVLHTWHQ